MNEKEFLRCAGITRETFADVIDMKILFETYESYNIFITKVGSIYIRKYQEQISAMSISFFGSESEYLFFQKMKIQSIGR